MLHVEKKKFFTLFIFLMLWMPLTAGFASSGDGIFNVKDFGAKGDGVHLETAAIQKTIDACAKTGGTVLLPPGKYLSGTLFLKSHVTLHLSNGALLLGSTNIQDYPETRPDVEFYGKSWVTQSLIYGENLEDVTITGNGTIDGQGSAFRVTTKKKPDRYRNRPYVLWFAKCQNVRVENVNLQNSAKWMQHYQMCDEVTIRGINVYNHANQNNDMMDIDGCHNVVISDCFGDTDDDALTLKSLSGRACENIAITNCVLSSHCNALKMGTESHAGFKNISISNIVIKPSQSEKMIYGSRQGTSGISLEVVDGGIMDGVTISNVRIYGPQVPLFIRLGNRGRVYEKGMAKPPVGKLRNINISNIVASAGDSIGCSITGLPGHPVENVSLSHIRMIFPGGVGSEAAMKAVPEKEDAYPEGTMFGDLPAYGLYIRHATGISLDDIDFGSQQPDGRPALLCDDVDGLDISGFRAQGSKEAGSLLNMMNVRHVFIRGSRPLSPVAAFLSLAGNESTDISLLANDLFLAAEIYTTLGDVPAGAVRLNGNISGQ